MPQEVPLALLLEGNVSEDALANALFTSLTEGVPVLPALVAGGVSLDLIDRYLLRTDTPALDEIVPLAELVEQLPRDLCARLLAVPVRRDISTGTVDVVVADPSDPHPAREISFHLGARVQAMRGSSLAIERALQHMHRAPEGALGSEIPLPLTRVVGREGADGGVRNTESKVLPSFIAGPPPKSLAPPPEALHDPLANIAGILTDLRAAASRDEVLELLLGGARMVARRVALFVVKRDGYLGWSCNREFGDRVAFQSVLLAPQESSVFEAAVRDGFYLGPLHAEPAHEPLLAVMNQASSHVAVVAVQIRGKTAAIVLADDLSDTLATIRELTELANTAGDALMHVVRLRRS